MKPTPRKIKQELKKLRAFIESHQEDSVEQAMAVECRASIAAIRKAIQSGVVNEYVERELKSCLAALERNK